MAPKAFSVNQGAKSFMSGRKSDLRLNIKEKKVMEKRGRRDEVRIRRKIAVKHYLRTN